MGLPANRKTAVFYKVLDSPSLGWSLMSAVYSHAQGGKVDLCQIVAATNRAGELRVLRKLPLKTTDADVPDAVTWSPLDITDVFGNGTIEFVLQADAYENHWLEMVAPDSEGSFKTIFAGLGYYL
jgi:hypothetical protein